MGLDKRSLRRQDSTIPSNAMNHVSRAGASAAVSLASAMTAMKRPTRCPTRCPSHGRNRRTSHDVDPLGREAVGIQGAFLAPVRSRRTGPTGLSRRQSPDSGLYLCSRPLLKVLRCLGDTINDGRDRPIQQTQPPRLLAWLRTDRGGVSDRGRQGDLELLPEIVPSVSRVWFGRPGSTRGCGSAALRTRG